MKNRFLAVSLVASLVLAGCATVNTALQYDFATHHVTMTEDTYRVFEHPKRDRIMTTPSLGRVAQGGAPVSQELHQAAARQYLDETGRENCIITTAQLLAQPQYEFFLQCP